VSPAFPGPPSGPPLGVGARTAWLASALRCTWRNQPVRTSWAMPAAHHPTRRAAWGPRIVAVRLRQHDLQTGVGVARVHADHRQLERTELVPEPDGQRSRLHADAHRVRCPAAHEGGDGVGFRRRHAFRQRPTFIVDHADRGRLLRNIEPHIALHRRLPLRLPRPSSQRGGITLSGVRGRARSRQA